MVYRKIEFVLGFEDGEEPDDSVLLDTAFEVASEMAAEHDGYYQECSVTVSVVAPEED